MKKVPIILVIISCAFLSMTCDKEDLPKPTQEGKNTMGAIVNGREWVPNECLFCDPGIFSNFQNNTFTVRGRQTNSKGLHISIRIRLVNITSPGDYIIREGGEFVTGILVTYGHPDDPIYPERKYYQTSESHPGIVTITKFDPINKIASGTFSFTAENLNNPNDIITVTKGRFDVKYTSP